MAKLGADPWVARHVAGLAAVRQEIAGSQLLHLWYVHAVLSQLRPRGYVEPRTDEEDLLTSG